jgi:hypothetical protein
MLYKLITLLLLLIGIAFTIPLRSRAHQPRDDAAQTQRAVLFRQTLDAKQSDARYLLTRAAIFDPLQDAPAAVRIGSAQLETTRKATPIESDARRYFIVQHHRAIPTTWANTRGLAVAGYLPNNAYLINATAAQAAQFIKTLRPRPRKMRRSIPTIRTTTARCWKKRCAGRALLRRRVGRGQLSN